MELEIWFIFINPTVTYSQLISKHIKIVILQITESLLTSPGASPRTIVAAISISVAILAVVVAESWVKTCTQMLSNINPPPMVVQLRIHKYLDIKMPPNNYTLSSFFFSFLFGVAHAPFACQRWGLPHMLATRNPMEGTSVVLCDTIRLTWWCV